MGLDDRLGRDIRNSLARAFVGEIDKGGLVATKKVAGAWLARNLPPDHSQYIHDRVQAFERAMVIITAKKIDTAFYQALVLWDLELFFEVHEILESAWLTALAPQKQILQAMIRAAGVYIHLGNGNVGGAEKMAAKARATLMELREQIPPFAGLDLLLAKLAALDPQPPKIFL